MKFILTAILLILTTINIHAGPKREVRGVWIATVTNIDWPSKSGLSSEQQKAEFIRKLNMVEAMGFNTVIVQVRPAADALYESSYEPWSRFLSGKQGQAPFPKYDPLKFMIEEARKRNMELHAWFNPYRALTNASQNPNPSNHVTKTHPDWIIHHSGKSYFDPGNPAAREYIIKVILEVVKNYDIDGVHIDDYFYPYPVKGVPFNDQESYQLYGNGMKKDDWRRNNVNTFVSLLNTNIKKAKAHVKFGVSPFGIWRNVHQDPDGSATKGLSCYDDIYSDVRLWMQNKWIDYTTPQLYWERGHKAADYSTLLHWWSENKGSRDLYIGLGLYRMVGAKTGIWSSPNEILQQIKDGRKKNTEGFFFYSISSFEKIATDIQDSLQLPQYFGKISIPPVMHWIDNEAPNPPSVLHRVTGEKMILNWTVENPSKEMLRYLVYRFPAKHKIDLNDNQYIIALTNQQQYIDNVVNPNGYIYIITALDRHWNESNKSNIIGRQ